MVILKPPSVCEVQNSNFWWRKPRFEKFTSQRVNKSVEHSIRFDSWLGSERGPSFNASLAKFKIIQTAMTFQ